MKDDLHQQIKAARAGKLSAEQLSAMHQRAIGSGDSQACLMMATYTPTTPELRGAHCLAVAMGGDVDECKWFINYCNPTPEQKATLLLIIHANK